VNQIRTVVGSGCLCVMDLWSTAELTALYRDEWFFLPRSFHFFWYDGLLVGYGGT